MDAELNKVLAEAARRVERPDASSVELALSGGRRRRVRRYAFNASGAVLGLVLIAGLVWSVGDHTDNRVGSRALVPATSPEDRPLVYTKTVQGNPDVYRLDISTGDETRLFSTENTQTDADLSPDGTTIIFSGFRASTGANDGIFVMSASGSGISEVNSGISGQDPTWSPDGSEFAFTGSGSGIYVAEADGSDVRALTDGPDDYDPVWSPNGEEIAFIRNGGVFAMNADGTNQHSVTNASAEAYPSWSPDGSTIAFSRQVDGNDDVYTIGSDGTGLERLTDGADYESEPTWAADGSEIIFVRDSDTDGSGLFRMSADGSNVRALKEGGGAYSQPDWN